MTMQDFWLSSSSQGFQARPSITPDLLCVLPLLCRSSRSMLTCSMIQRGGFTQSFGCMLVIKESTFRIVGHSENCFELLGLESAADFKPNSGGRLLGVDARGLFTRPTVVSLEQAVAAREASMLNPVWVCSRGAQRPFYAILHRIDVGIVIDLEPARSGDPAASLAGAVQSQKLAVRAITRLQALPGGDVRKLCDTLAEDVQQLTGYDRVMVYKFHEDDHGEVISEMRRSDLEPYLGLHYPATDIPQAARFLFKQNRVRIICDCNAKPVRVIQSEELKQPLCLVNSTLRSPHDCHTQYMANMGSLGSLVMAVIIKVNGSSDLWGLVVCHNTSPRYVPFPLRYACEFLMQAFALQLRMELQLASQMAEKKILRMQTLLCDMLLRDVPLGIVTQSPSITDLVKCDGAAMFYKDKCWLLGVTPTEPQVKELVEWLINSHGDSTGLSTESLVEIGYPGAFVLGDAVCGLVTARVMPNCILFWFRSHAAKEIKWGGAKHHPEDEDDGGKMHPRSSFKAFVEVVKSRSIPWEISEINAIHSLQLILRDSMMEVDVRTNRALTCTGQVDLEMQALDEISSVACEMVRLIETAIVPIFAVDSSGYINGWNMKIAELTGLSRDEAMGKSLADEVILQESNQAFETVLCRALQGEEDKNVEFKFRPFGQRQRTSVVYIRVNACTSRDSANNIIGVCFVGQDITSEKVIMDKFIRLRGDYDAVIQSLNPSVPAIFAADDNVCCAEWNAAMEILTGWMRHEVIGRMLPGDIFGSLCRLKGQETLTQFTILLYQAITVRDIDQFPFGFFDKKGNFVEVRLMTSKRLDSTGKVFGCFCFLQVVLPEKKPAIEEVPREDAEFSRKVKELAYVRQEMKNALNGIRFIRKLLETTATTEDQKQVLETSDACERQMMTIIDDMGLSTIDEGTVDLNLDEFVLGSVLDAIVSQVMISLQEKNLQMFHEIPEEMKRLSLHGDQARLQLVLSDFLENIVRHASSPDGWVEIKISPGLKLIQDRSENVRLQFRMTHSGKGMSGSLIQEMFGDRNNASSPEGLGLNLSRKLLNKMNGQVQYIREQNKCYFVVDLEMTSKLDRRKVMPDDTSM